MKPRIAGVLVVAPGLLSQGYGKPPLVALPSNPNAGTPYWQSLSK